MSPYYASPGPTVGSTIGGSHKASWEIAVLEITNNPKALNIKKSFDTSSGPEESISF